MTKYFSEFFGTALLLAVICGSGIMGENLADGNIAIALLANSIATGAGLYVLIAILGSYSGAHFNPAVSLVAWGQGELLFSETIGYWFSQISGGIAGIWFTHYIFGLDILQFSEKSRSGVEMLVSELAATLILLLVIRLGMKQQNDKVALYVAMTVTAGYWFTASTFFANPAVTIARSLTDSFVGIAPVDMVSFVLMQLLAGLAILGWYKWAKFTK